MRKPLRTDFTVVRKTKRVGRQNYQTFDQNSIFAEQEESAGNLVGKVVATDGSVARIDVVSSTFRSNLKGSSTEMNVEFRKEIGMAISGTLTMTAGGRNRRPHIAEGVTEQSSIASKLVVGDVVELQNCVFDAENDILRPWTYKLIVKAEQARNVLLMTETLGGLISSSRTDEQSRRDFNIAIAARGEATRITSFLDVAATAKSYLGYKQDMLNGFLLRGPKSEGSKVWTGTSCIKSRSDVETDREDDAVIIDFLRGKAGAFLGSMSESNPWELVPIYLIPLSSEENAKVETIATRYPFLVTPSTAPYDLNFAHCNVAIDFSDGQAQVIHFNLIRARPLMLESSLPMAARERPIVEENRSTAAAS